MIKEKELIEDELEDEELEDDDEVVENIVKSIESKIESKIDDIKAHLDTEIKKFAQTKEAPNALKMDKEEYAEFVKDVKRGRKTELTLEAKDFNFSTKTVGDMSMADSLTDASVIISELDPMVSRDPKREPFIEQLVTVGTISTSLDVWVETTDETGDPLPRAELAALPQKDYEFTEKSERVKKIGVFAKYSAEMAEDLPNLIAEVRNFLIADLRRTVDEQILSGDGEGENLTGILENATAYSAGTFAGTIAEANRFDVIETAGNQVRVGLHTPNYVVLHPTDVSKMRLSKGDDGHYVMPPFSTSAGTDVSGLRVIQNTGITAGNFLVGDFSKSSVKYRRGLTIEMSNVDDDDFTRDRFTVRAMVRLVHRVRANDYGAFVYGSFATAIAALEETS